VALLNDLASFLHGRWRVDRVINHGAGGFAGTATFTPVGGTLEWHEHGRVHLEGYEGEAYRDHVIVPDGDAWEVRFDDGRPFHPLDLRSGHAEVVHLCGPDTYRGRYDITEPDRFNVVWAVTGPGRADTIVTVYRRDARMSPSARTNA
jgi:hypothetical protein